MKRILLIFLLVILLPSMFNISHLYSQSRGLRIRIKNLGSDNEVGKQYLVIIAINRYQRWMPLKGPIKDAEEIRKILESRYYIDEVLKLYDKDATKGRIIELFKGLQEKLKQEDSVFIFYAGHGHLDTASKNGFWIPVDGGLDENVQERWIPNSIIRGLISQMKSKHILLISDSCFSGDLLDARREKPPTINNEYFKKAYKRRSRQVLTSGASERVPDSSNFARQLKLALDGNKNPFLDPFMLYSEIRLAIRETLPMFGFLRGTDHQEGASFLLFLKDDKVDKDRKSIQTALEITFWESIKGSKDPDDFKEYLRKFPGGAFVGLARNRIKRIANRRAETEPGSIDNMPIYIRAIQSKAKDFYKNDKGFWEADYGDGIVMVYIPEGGFTMGSNDGQDDEKPPHKVSLDGYWMGKTEVTVKQYMKFVDKTKNHYPEWLEKGNKYNLETGTDDYYKKFGLALRADNYPIIGISWHDASAYCDWLSKKIGLKFKLPTEAQWEKAARGTDGRKYPWGNSPPSGKKVNFADKQEWLKENDSWADKNIDDGYAYTAPVESFQQGASPYGILNMAGNVWEWCNDWYGLTYYEKSSGKNPIGPTSGTYRVLRGGGWYNNAASLRCAHRNYVGPSYRNFILGFRLCQDKE